MRAAFSSTQHCCTLGKTRIVQARISREKPAPLSMKQINCDEQQKKGPACTSTPPKLSNSTTRPENMKCEPRDTKHSAHTCCTRFLHFAPKISRARPLTADCYQGLKRSTNKYSEQSATTTHTRKEKNASTGNTKTKRKEQTRRKGQPRLMSPVVSHTLHHNLSHTQTLARESHAVCFPCDDHTVICDVFQNYPGY